MKTLLLGALCAALGVAGRPQGTGLSGRWAGVWVRQGDTLHVDFSFSGADDSLRGTFSSIGLRAAGIPLRAVSYRAQTVHFELRGDASTTVFDGSITGDSLRSDVRDGSAVSTLALVRATASSPDPYDEQDARFRNGGITLRGTLLVPRGARSAPAVVMMHGSGPEERSANRYLAEQLASNGVAALIYDKRGTGASSGDWKKSTFAHLAADAEAGVRWVRRRRHIDRNIVGIYGHSQGAMIGPMVASRSHHVAFFVASAAAGVALEEVERYSVENAFGIRQLPESQAIDASRYVSALVHTAYTGRNGALLDSLIRADSTQPWFRPPPASDNYYWSLSRSLAAYDLLRYWRGVDVPVLLIYGQRDERVPVERSIVGIHAALLAAGNRSCRLRVFPDADHGMRIVPRAGESFRWPQNADGYFAAILNWIHAVAHGTAWSAETTTC